jgi:hypothetical protein
MACGTKLPTAKRLVANLSAPVLLGQIPVLPLLTTDRHLFARRPFVGRYLVDIDNQYPQIQPFKAAPQRVPHASCVVGSSSCGMLQTATARLQQRHTLRLCGGERKYMQRDYVLRSMHGAAMLGCSPIAWMHPIAAPLGRLRCSETNSTTCFCIVHTAKYRKLVLRTSSLAAALGCQSPIANVRWGCYTLPHHHQLVSLCWRLRDRARRRA